MRQDQIEALIEQISVGMFDDEYADYIMKFEDTVAKMIKIGTDRKTAIRWLMEAGFLVEEFAGFLFAKGY